MPVVPVYIQEKIQPQVIVENLRNTATGRRAGPELTLFDDFNGIAFEELVDFYHHEQNWSNRMILGDSLLVMTSLAEKEGLKGKVQTIYLDPPYGIKFGSNWQVNAQARREGREGGGRHPPARADPRVPRHLGARRPLVPRVPARPARRRARAAN